MNLKLMKRFLAALLCLGLVGCASYSRYYLLPVDNQQQKVIYSDGESILMINKQLSVALKPFEVENKGSRFGLIVDNKSDKSFELSTDNIKAELNGKEIHVLSYEELQERIERAIRGNSMRLRFASALQSGGASLQGTSYDQGSFNYNSNNGVSGSGTYSGYSDDTSAVQQRLQQINSIKSAQIGQLNAEAQQILSLALKKTTVFPGDSLIRCVYLVGFQCGETYSDRLHVVVTLLGEDYSFDLTCGSVFKK